MGAAVALRSQIEASLGRRIPAALTPQPRVIRPVVSTGIVAVDEAVGGGVPVGAVTEVMGAECSGRTSLALSVVAQVMREGKVCAWVDVSDALSPESAAAAGCDLGRLLWVRCGVSKEREQRSWCGFTVPEKYFVPPPAKKGLHGGGFGMHPREEEKGLGEAVGGLLMGPRCAEPQRRVRVEARSGFDTRTSSGERAVTSAAKAVPLSKTVELRDRPGAVVASNTKKERSFAEHERYPTLCDGAAKDGAPGGGGSGRSGERRWTSRKKHWDRMDQALRAMDLLMQAGGFGAIVLDLGSVVPEHVSRIPLATWFRYRAAAERTQMCVVLLTQYPCAKSSAELVLRMERGVIRTQGGTVLTGFERRVEVVRRRFEDTNVVPMKKPPQRAGVGMWQSRPTWVEHSMGVGSR